MSLVNQALQKVRAQQAQQNAAGNAPVAYHISSPRGGSFGWKAIVGGAIVLGGVALAAWVGGIHLKYGQGSALPDSASAKAAESRPFIIEDSKAGSIEGSKLTESVKPQAATMVAVEEKQPATTSPATKSVAVIAVAPPVAQALAPATQPTKPAIEPKAVEAVLAAAAPEPAPVILPPAPAEPVVAKGPVLVNVQTLDVPGSGKIKLMAVSHSDNGSMAVINDTVVEVGDQIETATVVSIEGKRVQLKIDQKTFTLHMP